MADLNLLIAQLAAADEISESLGAAEPMLIEELQAALRDATVCAYRLRLARDLAAGRVSAIDEG
jgi:hypothetical protein